MYVLEVLPLSRSALPGTLSYRSSSKVAPGTFVSISIRKQTVPGIVISSSSVAEAKAQLKTASFVLSKTVTPSANRMPADLFDAAKDVAAYHAAPLGSVLSMLLGEVLPKAFPKLHSGEGYKKHRVENVFRKRAASYRTRIQKNTEDKKATLLLVPTLAELELFKKEFADLSPLILSGSTPAKKRDELLAAAVAHRGLILATPAYAWAPIQHLGAVIVERMSAGSYVQLRRPYLDMRKAAEALARAREIPFVIGDLPLPLEERSVYDAPLSIELPAPRYLFDARVETKEQTWNAIPQEMQVRVQKVLEKNGSVLLLAIRKGYAPTVICRDCGTAVKDSRGKSVSFAKVKGKNVFRSADGAEILSTEAVCAHCGSWNLFPLGIGVERVYEEAKKLFPSAAIVHFDASTLAQARKLLKEIQQPGTVVVGTEFMLPWIAPANELDLAVIVSADSLLSLPFWRARERFVRVGYMLSERAKEVRICTRRPEDAALEAVISPDTTQFFKEEAALRQILNYPPFGTLIHFSAEGSPSRMSDAVRIVRSISDAALVLPFQSAKAGNQRMSAVLHVKGSAWPEPALSDRIKLLPPWIRVRIDTESIW